MGVPVLLAAVIILGVALILPGRPWLLTLALLFASPVLAGFLTFIVFAAVGFIGKYQTLDLLPILLMLELGTALDCVYPAGALLALVALTASPIASRRFVSDRATERTRILSGGLAGAIVGGLIVLMLVIAHRARFLLVEPGPYPFQDTPMILLIGAIDGVLVATSSRRLILFAIGGGLASVPAALVLLWWSWQPPSDAALKARFAAHRADLDSLVEMMSEDSHMTRIADDFVGRDDDSEGGISRQRWEQYRSIFRRAGIRHGGFRGKNSCDVGLIVWTAGLAVAGSSVSFLHCGAAPGNGCNVEPPCREGKDSGAGNDGHQAYRYIRIGPDWYIFQDSD